jgi:hypothetical protein
MRLITPYPQGISCLGRYPLSLAKGAESLQFNLEAQFGKLPRMIAAAELVTS